MKRQLIILGAGSAGTMMAHHLDRSLNPKDWSVTIIDQVESHYYQPGFLFYPFGKYEEKDIRRDIRQLIPKGVHYKNSGIDYIDPSDKTVTLGDKTKVTYDILIIATGTRIAPEEVEGMMEKWHEDVFDFYTFEGASTLRKKLASWQGGKLVVHICETPIKCPVAPLEFAFLADDYFIQKGLRNKVDITYVTPMSGAFTKPIAAEKLGHLLEQKGIKVVPDFYIERVDNQQKRIYEYGGSHVDYDLLVTVPPNLGSACIARSGMGDDMHFVPTQKHSLQSIQHPEIFVLGDATNLPTSKAGSVAHFEAELLTENILRYIDGKPLEEKFDGHANCFVETGRGKALLIDFNYDQEPVTGTFPVPGMGPLRLLEESRINHWGKLAFKWIYWNMLLPAKKIPFITPQMNRAGKDIPLESSAKLNS